MKNLTKIRLLLLLLLVPLLVTGCALHKNAPNRYDPAQHLAETLAKGYRAVTGTATPEEVMATASQTLQKLPATSWTDVDDTPNLAGLHRLISSQEVQVKFAYRERHSVAPTNAIAPSALGLGFFRNKSIVYASVDWSSEKPSVFFSAFYLSGDDMAYSPRGVAFNVIHTDQGYCLGVITDAECFFAFTDGVGRAYLLENNKKGIRNQVIFVGRGDVFNIGRLYAANKPLNEAYMKAASIRRDDIKNCFDMIDGDVRVFNSDRAISVCGGMEIEYYPEAISGSKNADSVEWLNIEAKRINELGADANWHRKSESFYSYYVTHFNQYSRTSVPPLDRKRTKKGNYPEWAGEPVKTAIIGGYSSTPVLRSMLDERHAQKLVEHKNAAALAKGKTIVAVAPDYPPFGGRDLRFAGYTLYVDDAGGIYSTEGKVGQINPNDGIGKIMREKISEEISFASDEATGEAYLIVRTGPNAGLSLRVILTSTGDVFKFAAERQG